MGVLYCSIERMFYLEGACDTSQHPRLSSPCHGPVNSQQAAQLHAHFECARQLYNALLAEAMKRLTRMKADPTQAGLLAAFLVPTSSLARSMGSPNTACTRRPNACAPAGWLRTSTALWRRS